MVRIVTKEYWNNFCKDILLMNKKKYHHSDIKSYLDSKKNKFIWSAGQLSESVVQPTSSLLSKKKINNEMGFSEE